MELDTPFYLATYVHTSGTMCVSDRESRKVSCVEAKKMGEKVKVDVVAKETSCDKVAG